MSDLEDTLAYHLKVTKSVPPPVREHVFHPTRLWRLDFAWPDKLVAVEVDGGTHSQGRHTRGTGYEEDCRKGAEAAILGWRVIHVTGDMVESGEAVALVERLLGVA